MKEVYCHQYETWKWKYYVAIIDLILKCLSNIKCNKIYSRHIIRFFFFLPKYCNQYWLPLQKTKRKSNRIAVLERQIKWLENYSRGNNGKSYSDVVKQLKQELAALLEEDAKADKLRNLPLYSCRITGWKFVCSKCYGL